MRYNIKAPLSKLSSVQVVALARNVASKMTGNDNFPNPSVDIKALQDLTAELETAIEAATYGSKLDKTKRDELLNSVADMLRGQANYVRAVSDGDKFKLVSSGYDLAKVPEKRGVPDAPVMKSGIMTGRPGELELKWGRQAGVKSYRVFMTEVDPASAAVLWAPVMVTTKASVMIENLESFKAYWFCVSCVGAAGESAKSEPFLGRAA